MLMTYCVKFLGGLCADLSERAVILEWGQPHSYHTIFSHALCLVPYSCSKMGKDLLLGCLLTNTVVCHALLRKEWLQSCSIPLIKSLFYSIAVKQACFFIVEQNTNWKIKGTREKNVLFPTHNTKIPLFSSLMDMPLQRQLKNS